MEKQIDVMKQSTDLLETVYEGLQHIQSLLKDGKFEETISLFTQIVQAFSSLESSITSLPEEIIVADDIQPLTTKVRNALNIVVDKYEIKNYGKIQEVLQFTLIPHYKTWMKELDKKFNEYLVS